MKLPEPKAKGSISLEETIMKRRSKRSFTSQDLTWEQISQLLWAAQGITEKRKGFRAAPSAGALFPLEIYLVTKEGIFHYNPEQHEVEQTSVGDLRPRLCHAALNQEWIEEAPFSIIISAVYQRTESVYGQRGARYVHIEIGHVAQNIHLQAVALGLDSAPLGAFQDKEVQRCLSLPQDQQPLYIIPVGYAAE
jgi:SagB-type dehydrogenase family enzyme